MRRWCAPPTISKTGRASPHSSPHSFELILRDLNTLPLCAISPPALFRRQPSYRRRIDDLELRVSEIGTDGVIVYPRPVGFVTRDHDVTRGRSARAHPSGPYGIARSESASGSVHALAGRQAVGRVRSDA